MSFESAGTPVHYLSAANTNPTVVKAAPGIISSVTCFNTTAVIYWLKLHDTMQTPVAGTTPIVQSYPIPSSTAGNGFTINVPMNFNNGIAFTLVGAIADTDSSNAATGVNINFIYR
jgi:hypothetical protein